MNYLLLLAIIVTMELGHCLLPHNLPLLVLGFRQSAHIEEKRNQTYTLQYDEPCCVVFGSDIAGYHGDVE